MSMITHEKASEVLEKIINSPKEVESVSDVSSTLDYWSNRWKIDLNTVYMKGVDGAPDWLEYEHKIWQLGESLRGVFKAKRWKNNAELLRAVSTILKNENFGKGRQTFALLLGEYGDEQYGQILGGLLSDVEVNGHCIKALNKAKIKGYNAPVEEVYNKSSGWIRSAAKKYLSVKG